MSRLLPLLRLRLRRDRVQLSAWLGTALVLAVFAVVGTVDSFGTADERRSLLAAALANPVILIFRGLPSGAQEGAFIAFLVLPILCLLAALMSTFLAVRHTRADEEDGRAETLAATPAGRLLPVAATLVHGLVANLGMGFVVAAGLMLTGAAVAGSLLTGAAVGATGLVFLGLALLTAQVAPTPRAANSAAVWVAVAAFILAGFGNAIGTPSADLTRIESAWPSWLSPFGWAENTRPFDENTALPLLLSLASAIVFTSAALALLHRRDVGEGLVPARDGRRSASPALRGPFTLAWRLSRGALAGWTIGGLLIGTLATTLSGVVDEIGAENPAIEQFLSQIAQTADLSQAAVTTFFTMSGILAACAAVQTIARARLEEAHGRVEPVWSAAVDRLAWLAAWLAVALIGIVLVIGAALAGAALGATGNEDAALDAATVAAGGQAVAALVFAAIAALALVVAPRATVPAGWGVLLLGTLLGVFGPLFGFPEALVEVSPLAAAPSLDGDEVAIRGLWWLVVVASAGIAASLALARRRELATDG